MNSWQMARRLLPVTSPQLLCGSWWSGGNWEISCKDLKLQPAKKKVLKSIVEEAANRQSGN